MIGITAVIARHKKAGLPYLVYLRLRGAAPGAWIR